LQFAYAKLAVAEAKLLGNSIPFHPQFFFKLMISLALSFVAIWQLKCHADIRSAPDPQKHGAGTDLLLGGGLAISMMMMARLVSCGVGSFAVWFSSRTGEEGQRIRQNLRARCEKT
jgi:hypothetical protein